MKRRASWGVGLSLLLGGCASGLLPKPEAQTTLLTLDGGNAGDAAEAPDSAVAGAAKPPAKLPTRTLSVEATLANAGYDTRDIAYQTRPGEIRYFAQHQWLDTPARLLPPLMLRALQRSGIFAVVVPSSSRATADWLLETELLRLHQDFTVHPSRARLTLRARLLDGRTRHVLAWQAFDVSEPAASEDAYGGAAAASRALQQTLAALVRFCAHANEQA